MTYLSRCSQLIRDLKELNVLRGQDSVYFYLDGDVPHMSLEVYFHDDDDDVNSVNSRLTTIKNTFFQEFPEFIQIYTAHMDEGEIFFEVKKEYLK